MTAHVLSGAPAAARPASATRRVLRWQAGLAPRRLWRVWVLTRAGCVLLVLVGLTSVGRFGLDVLGADVLGTYARMHTALLSGRLPYRDVAFEYPPGVLPFLLLPGRWGGRDTFLAAYVLQMLVLDAVVARMLLRGGRGDTSAARLWVFGGAATLGLPLCRNDLPACALAVAAGFALLAGHRRRGVLALALGTVVKVWPVALLAVAVAGRRSWARPAAGICAAVGAALLVPAVALGLLPGLWTDLGRYHGARGVEVESVAALPALLAGLAGRGARLGVDHGSVNLVGSAGAGRVCSAVGVLLLAALVTVLLAARRRRGDLPPEVLLLAGCLAVVVSLLASKVLSAQYLEWLLAVTCVARAGRAVTTAESRLVLAAVSLTALVYPLDFTALYAPGPGRTVPVLLLLARDGVLAALAAGWAVRLTALCRAPAGTGRPAG